MSPGERTGFVVRSMRPDEADSCEAVLRSLPEWFGIEEAIESYRRDIEAMDTRVAVEEGALIGFITINHHNPHSAEIQVMAVVRDRHGQGVGRELVEHCEAVLRSESVEFLQVKTLGPSRSDENYARTRGFYQRLGFRPLEENHLWGEVNPCLIMVKHLRCEEWGASLSGAPGAVEQPGGDPQGPDENDDENPPHRGPVSRGPPGPARPRIS